MTSLNDIAQQRLISQRIAGSKISMAGELVSWMGAVQAQDYAMAWWALGLRLPGSTREVIEQAVDRGEIFRTHVPRPTWHWVSAENIYWMLDLAAPRIKTSLKSRHRQLEITPEVIKKSNRLIEKALAPDRHLLREELVDAFKKAGMSTEDNRASHLLLVAELDGLIASGAHRNGKPTYALLEARASRPGRISREEAAARLARNYFASHGPATLDDFLWWSGLTATEARKGLEAIKSELIKVSVDSGEYWFSEVLSSEKNPSPGAVYLSPAFDEIVIAYKNRSMIISQEHHKRAISANGIFWPTIIVNGVAKGTWKRTIKKDRAIIGIRLFDAAGDSLSEGALVEAANAFGNFLGKEITIRQVD